MSVSSHEYIGGQGGGGGGGGGGGEEEKMLHSTRFNNAKTVQSIPPPDLKLPGYINI